MIVFFVLLVHFLALVGLPTSAAVARLTRIDIPTVRYAHLLSPCGPYNLPCLNVSLVDYTDVINVTHEAVILENQYLKATVFPKMGRVYRIKDKITGHDVLWRNNIAAPSGANNFLGWWLWIGGIEYTLPGEEHGYTWALEWNYTMILANDTDVAVKCQVLEPTTGIIETLTFSLADDSISLDTLVHLHNAGARTAEFAHWTNVPFVPGPANRLPDSTEFIVPTESISVEPRWQSNLGPGQQNWKTSPLRFFANWANGTRMGDFTSNGFLNLSTPSLTTDSTSFFGTFSHEDDEGTVRVFDANKTPGLDTWTYGFHPEEPCFPQNRKISRCSYAEMWGGTVMKLKDLKHLGPGKSISWSESVAPFRDTQGLVFANNLFCANGVVEGNEVVAVVLSAVRAMPDVEIFLESQSRHVGDVSPGRAVRVAFEQRPNTPALVLVKSRKNIAGSFYLYAND